MNELLATHLHKRFGLFARLSDTLKQVPDQLGKTLGAIGEAWSHPVEVVDGAVEEAKRKLEDIKAGK